MSFKIKLLALCTGSLLVLAGCGKSSKAKNDSDVVAPAGPTFAEADTVAEKQCGGCHSDGSRHSHFVGHQDIFAQFAAEIRERITATDPKEMMPLQLGTTPVTTEEQATFAVFFKKEEPAAGAKAPTYAEDIAPVVEAKCAKCHGDQSPFLKFAGHEDLVVQNADKIYAEITATDPAEAMPPVTRVLEDGERQLLLNYIDAL